MLTSPARACRPNSECWDAAPSRAPVILCNLAFVRKVGDLIQIRHDQAAFYGALESDVAFIKLLQDIEQHPERIFRSQNADAMFQALLSMLLFFLAHEFHHAAYDAPGAHFEPESAQAVTDLGDQVTKEAYCRNSAEFLQQGWIVSPRAGQPLPNSPAPAGIAGQIVREARKVWEQELAADRHATKMLVHALNHTLHKDPQLGVQFRDAAIDSLSMIAMQSWYAKLDKFLSSTCPDLRSSKHALSRCLCSKYGNSAYVGALLGTTHPPITMRMNGVIRELTDRFGVSPHEIAQERVRDALSLAMTSAANMASGGCVFTDMEKLFPNATTTAPVTGLEGPWLKSDGFLQEWACECAPRPRGATSELRERMKPPGGCEAHRPKYRPEDLPSLPEASKLHQAIASGDVARVKALLASGADPNELDQARDETPITRAVTASRNVALDVRIELMNALAARGADVNRPLQSGTSALTLTILIAKPALMKALVDLGADVNRPAQGGNSPLMFAAIVPEYQDTTVNEIIAHLLAKGADVNAVNNKRETALILAARCRYETDQECGFPERIELLLKAGARRSHRDAARKTALDYAQAGGWQTITRLLK
jgi:ankyrin repeat protein